MPSAKRPSKLRLVFFAFLTLATLVLTFTLVMGGASAAEPVSVLVSPVAPDCSPNWTVIPSPSVGGGNNDLSGVAPISANDVWAVGVYSNGTAYQTLTEHWDGSLWSVVPSPNLGTRDSRLLGVAAISSNNVWAVGYYLNGTSVDQTLVLHWDGSAWSVTPSPNAGTSNNMLNGVAAVSANDLWAEGGYNNASSVYQTLTEHWDGSTWNIVASPNVGTGFNAFYGVAALSANDVWAVGSYRNASNVYQTLTEHWNGSTWNIVVSPNVGTDYTYLNGVTAVSTNDVWAVGYSQGFSVPQTLILHWDGSLWSVVPSPNVGTYGNLLNGVTAISSNNVWAAGYYWNGTSADQTLILHWDGSLWSVTPSPNAGTSNNMLNGVAALSANDVWTVGDYYNGTSANQTLTERYNPCQGTITPTSSPSDTPIVTATHTPTAMPTFTPTPTNTSTPDPCTPAWSVVSSPNVGNSNNDLYSVAVSAPNDIWAVGNYYDGSLWQTLIEHWDGTAWSIVSSPNVGNSNNDLYSVAVSAPNDIWAVGDYYDGGGVYQTLIEHWDGTAWSIVSSPNPGSYDYLYGVAVSAPNDVWAVGNYINGAQRTLIEHWNGTAWSVVSSPSPGTTYNYLYGVAVSAPNDVWAVGEYLNGSGIYQTLIEHWDGTAWSIVPSPNVGNSFLHTVAVSGSNDVWAAGEYLNGTGRYQTLIEHWDGTAWSIVPSPNAGTSNNIVRALAVAAPSDIWVVGNYTNGAEQTLTEHWDGTAWGIVPSPNVDVGTNILYGVAVAAPNGVWAVGLYSNGNVDKTLTEHWGTGGCSTPTPSANTSTPFPTNTPIIPTNTPTNTNTNTPLPTQTPGGPTATTAPTNTTIATDTVTGTPSNSPTPCALAWSLIDSPNVDNASNYLYGLAVAAPNDVWTVGKYVAVGNNPVQTLVERWDGTTWTIVSSPGVSDHNNTLYGVAVAAPNDVWAVGNYSGLGNPDQTLIEHWNGTAWSIIDSPNTGVGSNYLYRVAVAAPNDVWAVGDYENGVGNPDQTLVEHWNGTAWNIIESLNIANKNNYLEGVAVAASNDVWAVGFYRTTSGSSVGQTLVEHWNGTAWNIVSSPNIVGSDYDNLHDVAIAAPNDVWAVGS